MHQGSNLFKCSVDKKFGCLNPHHLLVGQTKNKGPPDKNVGQLNKNFGQPNQIAVWLFQFPEKVGSA